MRWLILFWCAAIAEAIFAMSYAHHWYGYLINGVAITIDLYMLCGAVIKAAKQEANWDNIEREWRSISRKG